MGSVFEVDPEGWRESNAGRPPAHLVRELVQNVFDEAATRLAVTIAWDADTGATVDVVAEAPGQTEVKYGRPLVVIFARAPGDPGRNGEEINAWMVRAGHGKPYDGGTKAPFTPPS